MVNGKVLIGQSIHIKRRWYRYKTSLRRNKYKNPHLQHAWNKYGENNFGFEILCLCSPENLDEEEIKSIKEHQSTNEKFGYNLRDGGGGGSKFTEESKRRMSERQKGEKSPWFGKHHSEETKQKMRMAQTGKTMSEESRRKMSEWQKGSKHRSWGKHHSEETKKKMSECNKGEKCCWFGKKFSEETKQKMREARQRYLAKAKSFQSLAQL
jgi:hypothetical protein